MKVIDLLNKIANGEAPKKIKYNNTIYYLYGNYNYLRFDKTRFFDSIYFKELNDEVEVIEEDKKIEKVNTYVLCDSDFERKGVHSLKATEIIDKAFEEYSHKINEIIDKLNEIEEENND